MKQTSGSQHLTIDCFVSMPFHPDFDDVYFSGIEAVPDHLKQKYTVTLIRLDRQVYARRQIEENVLRHIERCDVLIADITRYREALQPNVSVMHEIGFACGKGIPFILIGKKDTHKELPSNLKGSLVEEYDPEADPDYSDFSRRLAKQLGEVIDKEVLERVRGAISVACFPDRQLIGIPRLISNAHKHVYILTTILEYTNHYLKDAIQSALKRNHADSGFKVEILTMDPEGDVTNARAIQLGRPIRQYRNELRQSLDSMRDGFKDDGRVEIVTYKSLPTQMTFIVDDIVITGIVSLAQQSREGVHFVLDRVPELAASFLAHFRALKTLAAAGT